MQKNDLLIIGSGPGGYRAADYAAKHGLSVTIIEEAEAGGTCLNCGCIPTKALCHDAEIINIMRNTGTFGKEWTMPPIDFLSIQERKQNIIKQLRSGTEALMQQPGIIFVHGKAHFKDSKTVVADNNEYTADNIIIATGSSAKFPPIDGLDRSGVVNSTELLDIKNIPNRLCIIGAGVIGMEFASIFNSLGSKVTVLEFMKECLPVLDSDIAKRLRQTLSRRGVEFCMQSAVKSVVEVVGNNNPNALSVCYERKGRALQVEADTVLVATGRKPNIDGLALEAAGIEYSAKGIITDNNLQTSATGIYAIGDVNGKCMLAHAATFQGLHVINHILGKTDNIRLDIMPSAVFTNPEAAGVGATENMLKEFGRIYECRKGFYRSNGKAMTMDDTEGMIKLLTDPDNDGRITGCHAVGPHASDIIQEVTVLMNANATIHQLADIIHTHPTLSEILHDMSM